MRGFFFYLVLEIRLLGESYKGEAELVTSVGGVSANMTASVLACCGISVILELVATRNQLDSRN